MNPNPGHNFRLLSFHQLLGVFAVPLPGRIFLKPSALEPGICFPTRWVPTSYGLINGYTGTESNCEVITPISGVITLLTATDPL